MKKLPSFNKNTQKNTRTNENIDANIKNTSGSIKSFSKQEVKPIAPEGYTKTENLGKNNNQKQLKIDTLRSKYQSKNIRFIGKPF